MSKHVPSCHLNVNLDGPETNHAEFFCPGCGHPGGLTAQPRWMELPIRVKITCGNCGTLMHINIAGYLANPTGEAPAVLTGQGQHVAMLEHMAKLEAPERKPPPPPRPDLPGFIQQQGPPPIRTRTMQWFSKPEAPRLIPALPFPGPPPPKAVLISTPEGADFMPAFFGEPRMPYEAWRLKGFPLHVPEPVLVEAYRRHYGKEPLAYPLTGRACFSERELHELQACLRPVDVRRPWFPRARWTPAGRTLAFWEKAGAQLVMSPVEVLQAYLSRYGSEPPRTFLTRQPLYTAEELVDLQAVT
jgi:hypothetical protein